MTITPSFSRAKCSVGAAHSEPDRRTGFTLIELLVVIAILALLAAILFPVFARARENARRASCQSNLKQMGLGVLQYTQDFDERLPPLGVLFSGACRANYFQVIYSYVKSTQVMQCPSDSSKLTPSYGCDGSNAAQLAVLAHLNTSPRWHVGYPVNTRLSSTWSSGSGGSTEVAGLSLASVPNVAGVVLMADGGSNYSATTPIEEWTQDERCIFLEAMPTEVAVSVHTGSDSRCAPMVRHLGTSNVLFLDGHVKALQPSKWYYANSPYMNPEVGG